MVNVEVSEAAFADKPVVTRLLELYIHDLSGYLALDVDEHGSFGYRYLDHYWTEPQRSPFLIRVDGKLAGFALVRSGTPHDMAEFFVMRHYRHDGIAARAARDIFARFPGEWQVRQIIANTHATAFWRTAIPVPFRDETFDDHPVQRFVIEPI